MTGMCVPPSCRFRQGRVGGFERVSGLSPSRPVTAGRSTPREFIAGVDEGDAGGGAGRTGPTISGGSSSLFGRGIGAAGRAECAADRMIAGTSGKTGGRMTGICVPPFCRVCQGRFGASEGAFWPSPSRPVTAGRSALGDFVAGAAGGSTGCTGPTISGGSSWLFGRGCGAAGRGECAAGRMIAGTAGRTGGRMTGMCVPPSCRVCQGRFGASEGAFWPSPSRPVTAGRSTVGDFVAGAAGGSTGCTGPTISGG